MSLFVQRATTILYGLDVSGIHKSDLKLLACQSFYQRVVKNLKRVAFANLLLIVCQGLYDRESIRLWPAWPAVIDNLAWHIILYI